MEILDDLDRQLLTLLQANAREATATLARKLGVARTTVVARIARLEKTGVIGGYGVRLGKPGEEKGLRAYCALQVEPKVGPAVVKRLGRVPEIEELSAVSGIWDYMLLLRADSPERLDQVLDEIGAIEGVKQTTTAVMLARKIDRRG